MTESQRKTEEMEEFERCDLALSSAWIMKTGQNVILTQT